MSTFKIYCDQQRIAVECPFAQNNRIKAVDGAAFDSKGRFWVFPRSSRIASCLLMTIKESKLGYSFMDAGSSEEFIGLLGEEMASEKSRVYKNPNAQIPDLPFESKYEPRRDQKAAFWFGIDKNAVLLNMAPGRGKSKVAIDMARHRGHKRILIVCKKKAVTGVWPGQVAAHFHSDVVAVYCDHVGTKRRAEEAMRAYEKAKRLSKTLIVVINHDSMWRAPFSDIALKMRIPFDCLIVDECHAAKSPSSMVSKYLAKISKLIPWRIGLSGTALSEGPMDAYGVFRFLDSSIFGPSFVKFRDEYAIMGGFKGYQVVGYRNLDRFAEKFYSITFKSDYDTTDLPELIWSNYNFDLPADARKIYDSLEQEAIADLGENLELATPHAFSRLSALQQLACGYVRIGSDGEDKKLISIHNERADVLQEILDGIPECEPVVVFYRFRPDLEHIKNVAKNLGRSVSEVNGQKNELLEWQAAKTNLIAVQVKSGSDSIDLTRACYGIVYSNGWELAMWDQMVRRLHRPPQTRTVTLYKVTARRTMDVRIFSALRRKRNLIDTIKDEGFSNYGQADAA
jgi:hypothetical protein